jgi:hypothetical protein
VTKLSTEGELALRRLDDEDDEAERVFMTEIAPHLPGLPASPAVRAFMLLHREGLLEHLAPPKRKRGERRRPVDELAIVLDDVRRLKGCPDRVRIAAERHLRLTRPEHGEEELCRLANRLHNRLHRGTTGAERRRRAK